MCEILGSIQERVVRRSFANATTTIFFLTLKVMAQGKIKSLIF